VGVYTLLDSDLTGAAAVDFDKGSWRTLGALAYVDAATGDWVKGGFPPASDLVTSRRGWYPGG
jgi:hypothetical protein